MIQLNGGGTQWDDANGRYFNFVFLSPIASGDINLYLWIGGVKQAAVTANFTGASMTTWSQIEFDTSGLVVADGYVSRMDIEFSAGVNLVAADVYYFDDITQTTNAVLGTDNILNSSVQVYPNPVNDELYISDLSNIQSISILNVAGQVVKSYGSESPMDISALDPGVYVLQTNNGLKRKIIKN